VDNAGNFFRTGPHGGEAEGFVWPPLPPRARRRPARSAPADPQPPRHPPVSHPPPARRAPGTPHPPRAPPPPPPARSPPPRPRRQRGDRTRRQRLRPDDRARAAEAGAGRTPGLPAARRTAAGPGTAPAPAAQPRHPDRTVLHERAVLDGAHGRGVPAGGALAALRRLAAGDPGHGLRRRHLQALENRSEEHTSELQSRENLVCRLLLEKK